MLTSIISPDLFIACCHFYALSVSILFRFDVRRLNLSGFIVSRFIVSGFIVSGFIVSRLNLSGFNVSGFIVSGFNVSKYWRIII